MLATANSVLLTADEISSIYGAKAVAAGRGLRGRDGIFHVADLAVTEVLLAANGIAHHHLAKCLDVPTAPGQGVILAFKEQLEA